LHIETASISNWTKEPAWVASFDRLKKGNVGKTLMQKREQSTAPEWHSKIYRTRRGSRRPIAAILKTK
jgi:hypothetical protein